MCIRDRPKARGGVQHVVICVRVASVALASQSEDKSWLCLNSVLCDIRRELREGGVLVDAAGAIESAYIFDLNIFHILVFSHSFKTLVEAPPGLRKRRRGCQKMRFVLLHNESWSKLPVLAHSEQQSKSAENSPRVFVFLNFHHDGVLKI